MHQLTLFTTLFFFTIANIFTSYLYLYPIAHGCGFPEVPAHADKDGKHVPAQGAPFRLLLLGDPQLEGSSSLIDPDYKYFPSVRSLWSDVRAAPTPAEQFQVLQSHLRDLYQQDVPVVVKQLRKQLDLFGNDYYLAHIYRTLHWFTYPSHTAVLGDLLGSQWVDDAEFERRGRRFWRRVFSGGVKIEEDVTNGTATTQFGQNETEWKNRVINVAGNHDIGYAGDMTFEQVQRFERVFGKVNWETRFTIPVQGDMKEKPPPELKLVVLNSLNIDGPAANMGMQSATFKFLADVVEKARSLDDTTSTTVLLTHLPLHKEAGTCVDAPMIKYYGEHRGEGIEEQNHLSYDSSIGLLDSVFGLGANSDSPIGGRGSNGIIFTGHDHEGCDVYHHLPYADDPESRRWTAERWNESSSARHALVPGIREVTVRSMMGDFGGNAGLLSAWFDEDANKWQFEYGNCAVGKPHIWWAVHVLDIVALVMCIYTGVKLGTEATAEEKGKEKEKTL